MPTCITDPFFFDPPPAPPAPPPPTPTPCPPRQHGAIDAAGDFRKRLDAIFVCTGGGSLLAGVAAAVKQVMPGTKVIGVEPEDDALMTQSLMAGHRITGPEPSHFVDGAAVTQIGPEVFRPPYPTPYPIPYPIPYPLPAYPFLPLIRTRCGTCETTSRACRL